MQAQRSQPQRRPVTNGSAGRRGIVVAHGYAPAVRVERGHLVVEDGFGRQLRSRRFHRTARLRRLVVIGRHGYMTFDAAVWLRDVGATFVHLDSAGDLITTTVPRSPDLAALRRVQALATETPVGIEVARMILQAKVSGQRSLLGELPGGAGADEPVGVALAEIDTAADLRSMLLAESQAAAAYWQAWAKLPLPFPPGDLARLPEHWRTFGARTSLVSGGPRGATNPANAILNLLYALLEAETTLACHAVGLDPGLGVFHMDRRDRASMSLDVMEAARPAVDAYVLALLTQRTLSAREFTETREGQCRIAPRFAEQFVATCDVWRTQVGPFVERVAHMLARYARGPVPRLTPITRANWREAWDERAPGRRRRLSLDGFAELPSTCRDCGAPLVDRRRRYCTDCRATRGADRTVNARSAAVEVLARLRAEHRDPGHGGRAAELRGSKNAAHQRAVRDWTGERPDRGVFAREVLPGLRSVPVPVMVAATGLSAHYCSMIRLGKRVPHPRHWDALRSVAQTE
jgi:CRISPR-associated protein Cas1